ncbi:hypothetical protein DJ80_09175 [Halorubrum ezzemoulense]|uniref:Uncharacterized protein n=1 Tax=Halorubrum ezzemoulense TaxID=337243 RepID=A0A256J287_HALEZ|nr:hypothetical protein DJ80_09175 [Halorubrum ezzemoulense]
MVYQERKQGEEIPSTNWSDFEGNTPNDVLDRITRGILDIDPAWLGSPPLDSGEVTAVEENFDVSLGGGEIDPADRFSVDTFDVFGLAADTQGEIGGLLYEVSIFDNDGDDDITDFRVEGTDADGDSVDYTYSLDNSVSQGGEQSLTAYEASPTTQTVSLPLTATLYASDTDSEVELKTKNFTSEDFQFQT